MMWFVAVLLYVVIGAILFGVSFADDIKSASTKDLVVSIFLWPIVLGVFFGVYLTQRK